jgi:hypothetical protein
VREDLSWPQIVVQSCHAVIEATKAFKFECLPDHPHLVLLAIKDESRLQKVQTYLSEHRIQFKSFYESDINDSLTAVATEPIAAESSVRKYLRKFQLLKDPFQLLDAKKELLTVG